MVSDKENDFMIIELDEVFYDPRARDGTWCKLPYDKIGERVDGTPIYSHPDGCPQFPKCMKTRPDFKTFQGYRWKAVVMPYDLRDHMDERESTHQRRYDTRWAGVPDGHRPPYKPLTVKQRRNVLYWQEHKVRKPLLDYARSMCYPLMGDVLLDIPEANGVNVYKTMEKVGLQLKCITLDLVNIYKIVIIGTNR